MPSPWSLGFVISKGSLQGLELIGGDVSGQGITMKTQLTSHKQKLKCKHPTGRVNVCTEKKILPLIVSDFLSCSDSEGCISVFHGNRFQEERCQRSAGSEDFSISPKA